MAGHGAAGDSHGAARALSALAPLRLPLPLLARIREISRRAAVACWRTPHAGKYAGWCANRLSRLVG